LCFCVSGAKSIIQEAAKKAREKSAAQQQQQQQQQQSNSISATATTVENTSGGSNSNTSNDQHSSVTMLRGLLLSNSEDPEQEGVFAGSGGPLRLLPRTISHPNEPTTTTADLGENRRRSNSDNSSGIFTAPLDGIDPTPTIFTHEQLRASQTTPPSTRQAR